jgi:hypothetical protein
MLAKKRLIGNDAAVIVFNESGRDFCPSWMSGCGQCTAAYIEVAPTGRGSSLSVILHGSRAQGSGVRPDALGLGLDAQGVGFPLRPGVRVELPCEAAAHVVRCSAVHVDLAQSLTHNIAERLRQLRRLPR